MIQAISIIPIKQLKLIWFSLALIIIFLLIFSIYQFNAYTQAVYFISSSERKISQLSQENKILEIDLAMASSLLNMENYLESFEKTENITYIRVLEGTALAK